MSASLAIMDVNTQKDYMNPNGAMYVPDAEKLKPNIKRIYSAARKVNIPILASVDAHHPSDPEFSMFPRHCVKGKPGQKKISETCLDAIVIPVDGSFNSELLLTKPQLIFEKQTFDVFSNPHLLSTLDLLEIEKIILFGVPTDYAVKSAARGLLANEYEVYLVQDAVAGMDPLASEDTIEEIAEQGGEIIITLEAIDIIRQI